MQRLIPSANGAFVARRRQPARGRWIHRIEQSVVENEVKAAGFTLASKAEFLRNAADARDWSSSPGAARERLGTEDRFVLRFVKP
jgi:predicted methyltransferase